MTTPPKSKRAWLRRLALPCGLLVFVVIGGCYMMRMPGQSYSGPLPPLTEGEIALSARLEGHVRRLAGEIGERNIWRSGTLDQAAEYIAEAFEELGCTVAEQQHEVRKVAVKNLEVELPGATTPEEIVVVGAHYDTVAGSPGANDNTSGVAALLEIARLLRDSPLDRTVRFVAFVNEEPPFFLSDEMGSRLYARRCAERGEKIVAMLSLETIGCYTDEEGSQHYPFPFGLFYPGTGNFIAFVGNVSSRGLVCRCVGSFRSHTQFPSEGGALPGWIPGIYWSDHWSFWKEGFPALMVTDTAPFRYPHYHAPADTPDKIDYDRTARVVADLAGARTTTE